MDFWNDIVHFTPSEWSEDPSRVDPQLVRMLDRVRCEAGVAIHVHTAWSPSGHVAGSLHGQGKAVDFHFAPGMTPVAEFALLTAFGFRGIGLYPEWTPRHGWHVDLRAGKTRLFWTRRNGRYRYGHEAMAAALALAGMQEDKDHI